MSIQLFYAENISENASNYLFGKEESQHIAKVLRKKEGDILHITNGKGLVFIGQLSFASPKQCEVTILSNESLLPPSPYIHLVVAPTKMNERYEWFLEKATEIGINEVTPIICEHSERTIIKTERFEKIILSAMKQSLQYYLPKLNAPINSNTFFKQIEDSSTAKYIAHCQENQKVLFSQAIKPSQQHITVLIGPEGDFSSNEIEKALSLGFQPISLGDTRLRTETAAVVACHTIRVVSTMFSPDNQ
nr:16S rRNA (uracil(1498)-N(3))-methyltransferase [uncultured Capnocytophaga sp.]